MPAPVLWEPNDELKNLIRAGMSKIGQVYDKGESLYNQYAPPLVKETIHMWANQPQGLIPDTNVDPRVDMLTRLDNLVPIAAKALPALGAALGMAAKGGGKTSRSIDEVWGLVASDPKWEKAFTKLQELSTTDEFADVPNGLEEILEAAKEVDSAKDFLAAGQLRLRNRKIDLLRSRAGIHEVSTSDEIAEGVTKGDTLVAKDTDIPVAPEFANPTAQSLVSEASQAAAAREKAASERWHSLDWVSALKAKASAALAKGDLAPVHHIVEHKLDEYGKPVTEIIDRVPVAPGRPPSNARGDMPESWTTAVARRFGLDPDRFKASNRDPQKLKQVAEARIAQLEKGFQGNAKTTMDQLGSIKNWYTRTRIDPDKLMEVLSKHGATPEETVRIKRWIATNRPPNSVFRDYVGSPGNPQWNTVVDYGRVKKLFFDAMDDITDLHAATITQRKASNKAIEEEVARLRNLPKEALYGILSGRGPVKDRRVDVMRKKLISEALKGYTK